MKNNSDAIISIKPQFANAILSGTKTVELRRRIPSLMIGTRLWIYATLPTGAIIGSAILDKIVTASPNELWLDCGEKTGVDRDVYDQYFDGSSVALGLYLSVVRRTCPINIEQLRELFCGFHPPQVISKLSVSNSILLDKKVKDFVYA